jgi:pimeloyl-ACP methyl ester carboxylesterase
MPVLRLAGREDEIVWQGGWREPQFNTPNVIDRLVDGAGHFPWIENPAQVRAAFHELADRVLRGPPRPGSTVLEDGPPPSGS